MRHLVRNAVLVIAIILIAIASVFPPDKKLRLGKDLEGGFNVVYQVDVGSDFANREVIRELRAITDRILATTA